MFLTIFQPEESYSANPCSFTTTRTGNQLSTTVISSASTQQTTYVRSSETAAWHCSSLQAEKSSKTYDSYIMKIKSNTTNKDLPDVSISLRGLHQILIFTPHGSQDFTLGGHRS